MDSRASHRPAMAEMKSSEWRDPPADAESARQIGHSIPQLPWLTTLDPERVLSVAAAFDRVEDVGALVQLVSARIRARFTRSHRPHS